MRDLLRTGNHLTNKPTNFAGARISNSQLTGMIDITKANFKGHIKIEEPQVDAKTGWLAKIITLIRPFR